MSDKAQRVLDALIEYDTNNGIGYPTIAIREFFNDKVVTTVDEDYEALTADEEKQVIQAFLKIAY